MHSFLLIRLNPNREDWSYVRQQAPLSLPSWQSLVISLLCSCTLFSRSPVDPSLLAVQLLIRLSAHLRMPNREGRSFEHQESSHLRTC